MGDSLAYRLFYVSTAVIREMPSKAPNTISPTTVSCACCGRPWSETEQPDVAYPYQYGTSMAIEQYCTACFTPRIASRAALGVERFALGNPDNPVAGKLGMLPGSSGLINSDGQLYLGLPDGFIKKFRDGHFYQSGRVLPYANGMGLLGALLEKKVLTRESISDGIVFIETWGRKADILMSHLRSSRSLKELWCCSEAGASMLNIDAIISIGHYLNMHGALDKAGTSSFWSPIKAVTEGRGRKDALTKWASSVEKLGLEPATLLSSLPTDPHSRLRIGSVLQQLAPAIKAGGI